MTEPAVRAQYLQALGIEQWVRRSLPKADANLVSMPDADSEANVAVADWDALRAEVRACRRCALAQGRTQTVFGVGDTAARWMVIGEAPGAEEDARGEPFVGAAGQLLDKMLLAIDLPRSSVFIANMLKCRPPGNRDPKPEELACCHPYLLRQIALIQPAIILVVGRVAAQNLLQSQQPLARLRGIVHRFGAQGTPVIVTYHPAYLLRMPIDKRKAWDDLKLARQTFQQLGIAP